jgi:hypothetical protein
MTPLLSNGQGAILALPNSTKKGKENIMTLTNRMLEIASTLAHLYNVKADLEIRVGHLETDISGRSIALLPDAGWPGSNAEARKAAEKKGIDADEALSNMNAELLKTKHALLSLDAKINAARALQKAIEWCIRAEYVRVFNEDGIAVIDQNVERALDEDIDDSQEGEAKEVGEEDASETEQGGVFDVDDAMHEKIMAELGFEGAVVTPALPPDDENATQNPLLEDDDIPF